MKRLDIGLVYDLRSDYTEMAADEEQLAEFDSAETIDALHSAICALGHHAERIGNGQALARRLVDGNRWDLVFNIAEGLAGRSREAQVPCLLEMFGAGYTFADPLTCAVTLDKAMAKRIVSFGGVPTPEFVVIESTEDLAGVNLVYPLFAKPLAEGTGKGINADSVIHDPATLKQLCGQLLQRFGQPVLVEQFLPGREFTVAVLGNGPQARVLGMMEILLQDGNPNGVYSYIAKERCEQLVQYRPHGKDLLFKQLEQLALQSYRLLQCRDAARVDIRCDGGNTPHFLEINPLPGLHPTHSDLPIIAAQQGMSYQQLIGEIINSAWSRTRKNQAALCKNIY
jgi:D-alanine-D-alanine ligase